MAFIEFSGTREARGDVSRLIAAGGNGFIEFHNDDVSVDGGTIRVRDGAVAVAIDEPAQVDSAGRPSPDTVREACPTGITCCIGNVHLCCDDFRVIGSCAGAWGCSRPAFVF